MTYITAYICRMKKTLVYLSKASIAFLGLGCILLMAVLPVEANNTGQMYPEVADVVVPYSVAAVLVAACGVAALVALWRLITLINSGAIASESTRRWVGALGASVSAALALMAVVALHLLVAKSLGGPGVMLIFLASTAGLVTTLTVTFLVRNSFDASPTRDRTLVAHD